MAARATPDGPLALYRHLTDAGPAARAPDRRSLTPGSLIGTVPPPTNPPGPWSPSACPVPLQPLAMGILSASQQYAAVTAQVAIA
jgi:hypothetical protein